MHHRQRLSETVLANDRIPQAVRQGIPDRRTSHTESPRHNSGRVMRWRCPSVCSFVCMSRTAADGEGLSRRPHWLDLLSASWIIIVIFVNVGVNTKHASVSFYIHSFIHSFIHHYLSIICLSAMATVEVCLRHISPTRSIRRTVTLVWLQNRFRTEYTHK